MAVVDGASPPAFDYELYEGDPDHLRTVMATPSQPSPSIDSSSLKLKHRIGHGPFGDVWLATHHQSAQDYDEYHEVAVKMLHPIKTDYMPKLLDKFEEFFPRFRSLQSICWLHGISVISGKICIAMKFYEGSVGDRMAKLKGGKLPFPDVLRYGIELAKGINELHALSILVLNLKPTNLLLDEHDHLVLGDFGIPYLLLGLELPDPDLALRIGSPNYMAPEQWEPDVRGPLTFETDSWGFGCCMVEMLTGVQPWFGSSVDEIYQSVVIKQEKPHLPSGLPPAVENVLKGCFEYDLRNRPLVEDIIHAFESSLNAVYSEGEWVGLGNKISADERNGSGYSTWFLSKDHLQVGDVVRSRIPFNCCRPQNMTFTEGTIVGLEKDTDRDGFVLVRVSGIHDPLRVVATTLQRVTSGFAVGDWVLLTEENNRTHSAVGILHSVQRDGSVEVSVLGLETLWKGHSSQLQLVESLLVGHFVRLKQNIFTPRFAWLHKREGTWATGRISQILPNGCLVVQFPGRFVFKGDCDRFLADPAEVERVSFDTCPGLVEKYQHVEDFHWAVRPLSIAFGVFTLIKLGLFVGHGLGSRLKKGRKSGDGNAQDGHSGGNKSGWLANILPREANSATVTAR